MYCIDRLSYCFSTLSESWHKALLRKEGGTLSIKQIKRIVENSNKFLYVAIGLICVISVGRGGYRDGAKGAMAPPPCQGCPPESHKSAPGRAFWEFLGNFPENVPHVAKFIRAFCPTLSFGPSPLKILYPPLV